MAPTIVGQETKPSGDGEKGGHSRELDRGTGGILLTVLLSAYSGEWDGENRSSWEEGFQKIFSIPRILENSLEAAMTRPLQELFYSDLFLKN